MKNFKGRLIKILFAGFGLLFLSVVWFLFPVVGFHNCELAGVVWKGWSENGDFVGSVFDEDGKALSGARISFNDTSGGPVSCRSDRRGHFVCEPTGEGLYDVEIESREQICQVRVNGGDLSGMTFRIKVKNRKNAL